MHDTPENKENQSTFDAASLSPPCEKSKLSRKLNELLNKNVDSASKATISSTLKLSSQIFEQKISTLTSTFLEKLNAKSVLEVKEEQTSKENMKSTSSKTLTDYCRTNDVLISRSPEQLHKQSDENASQTINNHLLVAENVANVGVKDVLFNGHLGAHDSEDLDKKKVN